MIYLRWVSCKAQSIWKLWKKKLKLWKNVLHTNVHISYFWVFSLHTNVHISYFWVFLFSAILTMLDYFKYNYYKSHHTRRLQHRVWSKLWSPFSEIKNLVIEHYDFQPTNGVSRVHCIWFILNHNIPLVGHNVTGLWQYFIPSAAMQAELCSGFTSTDQTSLTDSAEILPTEHWPPVYLSNWTDKRNLASIMEACSNYLHRIILRGF